MNVKKVNAFTNQLYGGNPAGVVIDSPKLTDLQMKTITSKLQVSETAFVYPSSIADYKVRFFSPTIEVNLCGHATIATFFTLAEQKLLNHEKEKIQLDQETKAGILPVEIIYYNNVVEKIMMTQPKPIFKGIHIHSKSIAQCLNIQESDIDSSLPKQIVSTGLFTLPVCVKSLNVLQFMKPNFDAIKILCEALNVGSIHVFSFDTIEKTSLYHARNFAPVYGINEDPVTGTANGAVCSYLLKNKILTEKNYICEQGDIMGRPGRVFVELDTITIKVGGKARFVEEKTIIL
ncbi:MAG: PhzF family phenazine biosynthesis protein [Thermoplasmatota archaeon]